MTNLLIYRDALRLVRLCRPHWEALAACGDKVGADQLRRSSTAVPRNIAEGAGRYDGNGRQRFETARGEAHETISSLDIGVATGVLDERAVADAVDCADKIAATLWKMTNRRSA